MRRSFVFLALLILCINVLLVWLWFDAVVLFFVSLPIIGLGLYDMRQTKHTILRNYPVIGHFRYLLEAIRPEIHQYFVETELDGRPLNRERRTVVYERAKRELDTLPYGTRWDVYENGYEWINHSLNAITPTNFNPRVCIGGPDCQQPYQASILNISAMSFGALSAHAIEALNRGAKAGGFAHNSGEGGLSAYHLTPGGDLVWQIGTAYFGCRDKHGHFDPEKFQAKATLPNVKMIEIKLSQGAKPGHGGILPAQKITPEIAEIRHVALGEDVVSPPTHSAFNSPIGLLHFIKKLRALSDGKPVGFKLCVGHHSEFYGICKAMLQTQIYPDFITVDGGEGGTGAAPLEFSNTVGNPLNEGLIFVHNALVGVGLRQYIRIICSGKVMTAYQLVSRLAMGADVCNAARAFMLALGCIQSLTCNTNRCPTGVATQDPARMYGLVVENKYQRVANYHRETVKAAVELLGAAGLDNFSDLKPYHIYRRIASALVQPLTEVYEYYEEGALLRPDVPESAAIPWKIASPEKFT